MELLLDTLKWSVIVGAAALLLTVCKPLLDHRYSAKWRYGAWLAMAAFLLLAPVQWEALAPRTPVTAPVVIEVPKVEVSLSRQEGLSFQRPDAAQTETAPAVPSGTGVSAAQVGKPAAFPLEKALTGLWLAGMQLFFSYYLLGTWYFTRRARRWSCRPGEATMQLYEAVWREMGLKKAPPLRFSRAVDSPMVVGLFRPCLLLPGENFSVQELIFILRHELTHYRRRDLWYKLVLLAANGLHWFNPLVWLMRREAERDLELTCDDAVVAGRDDMERRAYSEALLASIHRQRGLSRAALSTHFYGGAEVMKERFRNILGRRGRKWGGLALAMVLLVTVTAACAVSVQASKDGALTAEELAQWQEKVESPEMDHYIYRMYTDLACLPSEETMEEMFEDGEIDLGHEDINPRVLSGTKNGNTVTLEIEGNFASRLPTGTLTLVDGEPVSFTTPLYTAVETAARQVMENAADEYISEAKEYRSAELEFTEKYITNLFCPESVTVDGKTYYVWMLYYRMKPNDMDNVFLVGGMSEENGWVTESGSPGNPILIFSVDADGSITLEEHAYTSTTGETGYTWEEYIYCHLNLGMGVGGVLNGWPQIDTPFLESLRDGHDTWALDWQDVAISYLSKQYGIYADGGFTSLRTFKADEYWNDHDEAVLARAVCGDRTVTLLLAHVAYPVEVWDTTIRFWQVVGVKWDPDAPAAVIPPEEPETPDDTPQPRVILPDELDYFASYFNSFRHNGLLRAAYDGFDSIMPYLEIVLYDMGTSVTDEEERAALADMYFDGELPDIDCSKLTSEEIEDFFYGNCLFADMRMDTLHASLEPVKSQMLYLEDYDAFYLVHGDTMMANYTFDRGVRNDGGTVDLYYTTTLCQYDEEGNLDFLWDQPMCVRLYPYSDNWLVISNTIVE